MIKKIFLVFSTILALVLVGCASPPKIRKFIQPTAVSLTSKPVTILIPGWKQPKENIEFLRNFVGALIIKPQVEFPFGEAADDLFSQLKKLGLNRRVEVQIVAYSWGGLIARKFAEKYSDEIRVKKIIQIGTPNGGYWMMRPKIFFGLNIRDAAPVYVIAGDKSAKKWFLRNPNDGAVDLDSALDVDALADKKIFHLDHVGLIGDARVASQVRKWLIP